MNDCLIKFWFRLLKKKGGQQKAKEKGRDDLEYAEKSYIIFRLTFTTDPNIQNCHV